MPNREREGIKAEEREGTQRPPHNLRCREQSGLHMSLLLRGRGDPPPPPPPLLGSCQRTPFLQLPWSWATTLHWLQAGTDEPFSQQATGIVISLSGKSPNQKQSHANQLGKRNRRGIGSFAFQAPLSTHHCSEM